MDSQDHKIATSSAGHEVHGVHLCHRCGWPFPNPHPSAKHRRAHKRHCGTIEGYEVIHSEEHDHHLVASDDDQASDEDELTPSPKPMKKNLEELVSSGGVGEMSNRSEDDVFTDAVTEFSDSGISPQSLERFESAIGLDKGEEQKRSENDSHGIASLKVNETADKPEQYNDATNGKGVRNPGPRVTVNNQSGIVAPITESSGEAVSAELGNNLQDRVIKLEVQRDVVEDVENKCVNEEIQHELKKTGHDSDIQREEQKSASVYVDSNEAIVSSPTLIAVENKEELHDKLVPEMVKPDLLPQTETLQNKDTSTVVETAAISAAITCSSGTAGEITLAKETYENTSVSTRVEKDVKSVGASGDVLLEENLLIRSSEGAVYQDTTIEPSNVAFSAKEESKQKSSLADIEPAANDASKGEYEADGNENDNGKSDGNYLIETVSALGSADSMFAAGDDYISNVIKGDGSYCEEKSGMKGMDGVTEKGGDSEEAKGIVDPTRDKSTDSSCLTEADRSVRNVEELSKSKSDKAESNLEKSVQGQSSDKLDEELNSVGTVNMDAGVNHNVGVLSKQSGTATLMHPMPLVVSKSPNNIHVLNNVELESAPVAGIVEEVKDTRVIIAAESTPEQLISKESTFPDSELLKENSVKEDRCIGIGVRELNHDINIAVHTEISESPNHTQQENLSAKKCCDENLPDVDKRHASEDISTSKPSDIVLNTEQTSDGNIAASEKYSVTPNLNEAVPSSFHLQESQETSAAGDDKNVIKAEPTNTTNSKCLRDEDEEKLSKLKDVIMPVDQLDNSTIKSEDLNGNCEVVSVPFESNTAVAAGTDSPSPDSLTASSQRDKTASEEAHPDKSDDFEPPSFMTLVQSNGKHNHVSTPSEIEIVQNNQQAKPEVLQAGWFPSLTSVVNESEGRKKNEEIIAKVTNSSPKHHSPLKNLLNEAKSPTTKEVPAASSKFETEVPTANPKFETEPVHNRAGVTTITSTTGPEAPVQNDHVDAHKDIDEWNSPARYPIETKKEKKKGKSIWVPFICCSSVHKDL